MFTRNNAQFISDCKIYKTWLEIRTVDKSELNRIYPPHRASNEIWKTVQADQKLKPGVYDCSCRYVEQHEMTRCQSWKVLFSKIKDCSCGTSIIQTPVMIAHTQQTAISPVAVYDGLFKRCVWTHATHTHTHIQTYVQNEQCDYILPWLPFCNSSLWASRANSISALFGASFGELSSACPSIAHD